MLAAAGPVTGRPVVLAVDGRSAGGKSTLARRLAQDRPGWCVVHTDDVAWWHSFFDWDDLLATGVLAPARRGEAVAYRPPAWDERGREGAVRVPAGTRVLVVEGVGSSRRALAPLVDAAAWVSTPFEEVLRREAARAAAGRSTPRLQRDWMAAELPFLAADRPWTRAAVLVDGTAGAAGDEVRVLTAPAPA
ncbi:hypothetical protein GTR00_15690 [Kineococcus sp. T90]|nr:hypothetical protein [Kineococcus indalonis]